ncbi:hypothetical protein B0T14DRAFT_535080 [Immersiella caudata]|uniref:Pro-apoptotic serine protease NMA111 n=1 Tax=Immersiella caudata TaxID=314043 RepID=A0AA39X529_9PEZI|nr:hypothetical protein B0T14DRAFT_535080 [Immersiella caudata]
MESDSAARSHKYPTNYDEDSRIRVADTNKWQSSIKKVICSVVSVHFRFTRSFDTEHAGSFKASGFIVDSERGYILTNRHVVGPGPFRGVVVLSNHEEADAYPVYCDPVHDFGYLKFDPKAIQHMLVTSLPLRPDLAKVGTDIRMVGNDAGETLSILTGASSAATGGSSGSPVVNLDGYAVALQAGGRGDSASTNYFLPLDRPLRALECLQKGKPITRGDIQCKFQLRPFNECRRFGLSSEWESQIRQTFPNENGMLVVDTVLPEGPSDRKLDVGDVLIKVNGNLLIQFIRLDDILDSTVGQTLKFLILREGKEVEVEIEVGDLHKITPDRFVSVSGGIFQEVSYQLACRYKVACKGVYYWCADDEGWFILSVDHAELPELGRFIEVASSIPDRERCVVRYRTLQDPYKINTCVIKIDRHWREEMELAVRNDELGLWDFSSLADPLPPAAPIPQEGTFGELTAAYPGSELVQSFVYIECTTPLALDGIPKDVISGWGLVIDADKGMVITSRETVPHGLCDISITIADSIIVEGKVVFFHPMQGYVIIGAILSTEEINQGASTYFIGHNNNNTGQIVHTATTVTEICITAIPVNTDSPTYRAINIDTIKIETRLSKMCNSGVLWLGCRGESGIYCIGLATPAISHVVHQIRSGIVPKLRILPVEFGTVRMTEAGDMGVPKEWIRKFSLVKKAHRRPLIVKRRAHTSQEQGGDELLEGDIPLYLGDKVISKISDLDVMYSQEVLDVTVIRHGQEVRLELSTIAADDLETDRVVLFCGATLQAPHHAVQQLIGPLPSEVYVSDYTPGSPADQYGLKDATFITHVNDEPTPNLDFFAAAHVEIPDNIYFRLRAVTSDGVKHVITIKKDEHFFPSVQWIKDSDRGWRRVSRECGQP